jgi:hypothetical protein
MKTYKNIEEVYREIEEIFKGYVYRIGYSQGGKISIEINEPESAWVWYSMMSNFVKYCEENKQIKNHNWNYFKNVNRMRFEFEYSTPNEKEILIEKLDELRKKIVSLSDHKHNISYHYNLLNSINEDIYKIIDFIKEEK